MSKSFLERRFESPDYDIAAYITGVRAGNSGMVQWKVHVDGIEDEHEAAGILERAAEVLRDKESTNYE